MTRWFTYLRWITGRENMPAYAEVKMGRHLVWVVPNKRGLIKKTPFFNGSNVCFDLVVKAPLENNIDEKLHYEWELFDTDDKKVSKSGEDIFHFSNIPKVLKAKPPEGQKFRYVYDSSDMTFKRFEAIKIGRLWGFHTYDLKIKEFGSPSEKEIVTEFSLQNIDVHQLNYIYILVSAFAGALAAVIVSILFNLGR
jgi:hypothetical protein